MVAPGTAAYTCTVGVRGDRQSSAGMHDAADMHSPQVSTRQRPESAGDSTVDTARSTAAPPPQPERVSKLAQEAIAEGVIGYRCIVGRCITALGRPLLKPEKTAITQAIHSRHDDDAAQDPVPGATSASSSKHAAPAPKVLLFTGFSLNYTVGHLCAAVNRAYAARHGYGWICDTPPLEEMTSQLGGAAFGSWYKVLMINRLLDELGKSGAIRTDTGTSEYTHLMWIDADAVVVDHSKRVEQLIALGGRTTQLTIAEDMTPCCLLNAGVLIIRNSAWSRALWSELWTAEWTKRYRETPFYEQTALIRWLQTHCEDICAGVAGGEASFHSYRGGPVVKRSKHLCVVSHEMLNTNQHARWALPGHLASAAQDLDGEEPQSEPESFLEPSVKLPECRSGAQLIFHAVGLSKLHALVRALNEADSRGLVSPMSEPHNETSASGSSFGDDPDNSWDKVLVELRLTNPRYVEQSGVLPAERALRGDDGEVRLSMEWLASELLSRQARFDCDLHRAEVASASALASFCNDTLSHTWLQILDLSSNCIVRPKALRCFSIFILNCHIGRMQLWQQMTCSEQGDKEVAVLKKALCVCVTLRAISLAHNALDASGTTELVEAVLALQRAQAEWCTRHGAARYHDNKGAKVTNRLLALDLTDAFASDADIGGCHAALMCLLQGQTPGSGLQYMRLGENRWAAASANGQQLIEAGAAVSCTVLVENVDSKKSGEEQSTAVDSEVLDSARIEKEKQAAASF